MARGSVLKSSRDTRSNLTLIISESPPFREKVSGRPRSERAGASQVLERVKDPLQTLVSRDQYETAYAVLAHFFLIAQRAPILFSQVDPVGPDPLSSDSHALCLFVAVPWAAAAQLDVARLIGC